MKFMKVNGKMQNPANQALEHNGQLCLIREKNRHTTPLIQCMLLGIHFKGNPGNWNIT
jgi:hypothetical protein